LFTAFAAWGFATGRGALSPGFYWFVAGMAGLMFLMAIGTTIRRMQLQLTMSLREPGVTLIAGSREHNLAYRELDALTIAESGRYDDARNLIALNRSITLDAAGKRASASYVAVADDPLDDLLQELVERMARERRDRSGEGWSIENEMLIANRERVPLSTISAAGVFDREVRVWCHGRKEPLLAVPLSSRNARLLLYIAGEAQTSAPPRRARTSAAAIEESNIELFTRRTSKLAVLFQTALLGCVIFLAQYAVTVKAPALAEPARIAAFLAAAAAMIAAIHRMSRTYHFHEHSVTRTSLFGSRTFRYEDAVSITWKERSSFLEHTVYLGTSMTVTMTAANGAPPFVITLHRFRTSDEDLLPLRRAVSERIAVRLHHEWKHGERSPWTNNAAFTAVGLEVKTGVMGGGRELLPYGQPLNAMFSDGYLIFFRDHWTKPLTILETSQENFYPGLALFERLTPLTFHEKRR
jgi:hypothetical protein